MKVQDVELEIVNGDGENLKVDVVVLESVEDRATGLEGTVSLVTGGGHSPSIIASLVFDQTLNDFKVVRRGYHDALHQAAQMNAVSMAIVPFGYEKGVISPEASAKILAQELLKFIRFEKHHMKNVYVCVTDTEHFEIFFQSIIGYLTHIQDTLGMGPYVTVDAIIEFPEGIVLIDRSNPPYGWALPGGFVDYGESLEAAVLREVGEETGLGLADLRQFKVYSDPNRDPRFHTVSTVFIGRGIGNPRAGDDAKGLKIVAYEDLLAMQYAFDHGKIIREYLETKRSMTKVQ